MSILTRFIQTCSEKRTTIFFFNNTIVIKHFRLTGLWCLFTCISQIERFNLYILYMVKEHYDRSVRFEKAELFHNRLDAFVILKLVRNGEIKYSASFERVLSWLSIISTKYLQKNVYQESCGIVKLHNFIM
jgi:hypothetical protein